MKKFASSDSHEVDPNAELANSFWRWFSLSVFILLVASAIPAFSADVFIDEGDTALAPTPVSAPATPVASNAGGKAPASEDIPPAGAGDDLDAAIGDLEPSPSDGLPAAAPMDMSAPVVDTNAKKVNDIMAATPKKKSAKSKKSDKKTAKASSKKSKKDKVAKKADKKKSKSAAKSKKKSKKTAEFHVVSKKAKKKSVASMNKKSKKRGIASFAGGKYAIASRSCALESSPGAGDSHGTTVQSRKLWVEDSGSKNYYKVYDKTGSPAFVKKKCF